MEEILSAVRAISDDINTSADCFYMDLVIESTVDITRVMFLGITIWSSETDDRPIGRNGFRIPLEDHLRECIREELEKIRRISV